MIFSNRSNSQTEALPTEEEIKNKTWKLFSELGDMRSYRASLPAEECKAHFDKWCNVFVDSFFNKLNELKEWVDYTQSWSEERLWKAPTEESIPKEIITMIIAARNHNLFNDVHLPSKTRIKFCESFYSDKIDSKD